MNARRFLPVLACIAAMAASEDARAQFATPRSVDDIDLPAPKRPKAVPEPTVEEPEDEAPIETGGREEVYVPGHNDEATRRRERPQLLDTPPVGSSQGRDAGFAEPQASPPAAGAGADAGTPLAAGGAADAGTAVADAGTPPEQARESRDVVLPPADGDQQLRAAWAERQKALDARSFRTALEVEKRMLSLRDDLGYANLFSMGAAIAREAEELFASDPTEALRRAVVAAEFAPDLPYAHWTIAKAAFNDDLLNVSRYVGSSLNAMSASMREPRWRAAIVADAGATLVAALLIAGALTLLLVFVRHARFFLHDFHHVFPAGASWLQTTTLAVMLLALPLALGFGVYAFFVLLALSVWLHMARAERVVIGVWLASLGLVPGLVGEAARWTTFSGTRAETVYLAERGGAEELGREAGGGLRGLAERGNPPFQVAFAMGHQARRRGEVESAVTWLRRAAEMRPSSAEALLELGNALFMMGDLDGARESYQRAGERDPTRAEPPFNLGRLYAHRARLVAREEAGAELSKSQEYVRKAIELDPKLGMLAAGEIDYRSNRLLAGLALATPSLTELAHADAHPERVGAQAARWLMPPVPASLVPIAALIAAGLLFAFSFAAGPLSPSRPCTKCGRPVCRRCDAEVVGPGLCGQCVHVFGQRGAVDPTARAAKELGIKRFQRRREGVAKGASLLLCGAGQVLLGRTVSGSLLLFAVAMLGFQVLVGGGVVNAPVGAMPVMVKLVPALLVIVLLHALAARRIFASFRSQAPKSS